MPKAELVLGAAQLGMAYGVANRRGKMPREEALEFLAAVSASGVNWIDTSPAYGESEALIGEFLRLGGRALKLVTKLPALGLSSPATFAELLPRVREALEGSLQRLGRTFVDDYLIHAEGDLGLHGEALVEALLRCRDEGLCGRCGVSIYTQTMAERALALGLEAVQVPCNVLDRRLDDIDFFARSKEQGFKVSVRSLYLQGVLLLPVADIVSWLPGAKPHLLRFHQLAEQSGRTAAELAFVYLRDKVGVDNLVVGMESENQLSENLGLMKAEALSSEQRCAVENAFAQVPEAVLNPSLWRRA